MKNKKEPANDFTLETIYAFAHCETWLEDYCKSHQIPCHELTNGVANLLLSQTGRTLLGVINRMPALQPTPTKRGKTVATVALDGRAHSQMQRVKRKKRVISAAGRKRMAAAQRKRWKLYHGGRLESHSRKLAWRKQKEETA